jgi:hypothetical protein
MSKVNQDLDTGLNQAEKLATKCHFLAVLHHELLLIPDTLNWEFSFLLFMPTVY